MAVSIPQAPPGSEQAFWQDPNGVPYPGPAPLLRAAGEAAAGERAAGASAPSPQWAARWGLPLGLARLLAERPPQLADGTVLDTHQVEVLAALLAALSDQQAHPPAVSRDDPNAARRFFVEHATGAGKTVTGAALAQAMGCGRVLILTHRRSLVHQFEQELRRRGLGARLRELEQAQHPQAVAVTTYQQWNRRWTELDPDYWSLVLCDEVHQALGPTTANAVRAFDAVTLVGLSATGQLLSKEVAELFPRPLGTLDLAQATRRGVLAPLRGLRIQPALGIDTLQAVRRRGGDLDPQELARLLNRDPLNHAVARFYRESFGTRRGVIFTAGVEHAQQLASALLATGVGAAALSGQTPDRELTATLERFEAGELTVLCNAQLLTEGWNSHQAEVCLHLAPTASPRVYQQRVGRVTRRAPGKRCGWVVDFVPPDYANSAPLMTLHRLLDLPLYLPGAPVTVGPQGAPDPEPEVRWPPHPAAPTAGDPAARAAALAAHYRRLTPAGLAPADRAQWAAAAGTHAASPAELRATLRALDGDPQPLLACLRQAAGQAPGPVRSMAEDRLAALAADLPAAWETLAALAAASDRPAHQRALSQRALELAAAGAADALADGHAQLLALAAGEALRYWRLARSRVGALAGLQPPSDPAARTELALRARRRGGPAGAALLAALGPGGPAGEWVLAAAVQGWPQPRQLAADLQTGG